MRTFETHIAWRYLFSKKSHNAINIVSGVSAAAVCVVTAAMVCVLSVMNGFGSLIESMFSQFDPPLRVTAAEGKSFSIDNEAIRAMQALPFVDIVSQAVEETALISYKGHQVPAHLIGVDDDFQQLTAIDSIITDGSYSVFDGAFERAVLGRGLAAQVGINAHFVGGLHIFAPKRNSRVNLLRPDESFNETVAFISGTFAVNQVKYDDAYMLISLPLARELFEYDTLTVTALNISLTADAPRSAKRQIRQLLGPEFNVLDRYEQQEDFFRIFKIEKLLTILLLAFILLIACFNIISSLSMLIIDKKKDIVTLRNLGADDATIRRIFLLEGWLISSLGAVIGLVLGLAVCLIQQYFGIIKLGNGTNYVVSTYPVEVQATDILIIGITVLLVGFVCAWQPVRKLKTSDSL